MRGAALGMKLEGTLGCLARLRRHSKIVVDVNRLDADRVADARDATVDSGLEGIAIKRDLAPCQGATQRAVHSARDRGHDVVERRGHWRSFLGAVILTERSLDTVRRRVRAHRRETRGGSRHGTRGGRAKCDSKSSAMAVSLQFNPSTAGVLRRL